MAGPTEKSGNSQATAHAIYVMGFVGLALLFIAYAGQVLLLAFAGVLVGVVLGKSADTLSELSALPRSLTLVVIVATITGLVFAGSLLLAPQVIEQSRELASEIPKLWRDATSRLGEWLNRDWFDEVTEKVQDPSAGTTSDALKGFLGILASGLGVVGSILVVIITGLYLAATPKLYRDGALRLVPKAQRKRASGVADEMSEALLWWMVGKLISMVVVGLLTFAGLWLLGVPLALSLSILAALLTFIPNFGPILAAVPAVLLGFGEGSSTGLYVVGLYVAIQTVESYAITPLIQQRAVSLPPALTITAQLIMGVLAGGLGLALATPLAAATLVLVSELYVKDQLERD